MSEDRDADFERLLLYIHRARGFDFGGYKRPSLMRRVAKRMMMVGIEDHADYLDYLEVHPEEFTHLFDTILINVTAFWRDAESWEFLANEVVPRLVARKHPDEPIRLWSAGCASGEEAYSLAMVMAEALGTDSFSDRVKIYATDVDEEALAKARQACFQGHEVKGVPPALLEKYFEPATGDRHAFRKDLRRSIIFGRHDLIQDPPISRIDLLACRNTLMYLNAETQARILGRFHFAVTEHGVLFLGKAETIYSHSDTFVPLDLKRRVFTKAAAGHLRDRLLAVARGAGDGAVGPYGGHARLHEAAFECSREAQVVVDFSGLLAMANERARALFGLDPADLGRPLQDLQLSYRPADLRSCIDRAYADRRPVLLREVEWGVGEGETVHLDVQATPLLDPSGDLLGAGITFDDVTDIRRLRDRLQTSTRELEVAYEELQSTNEELETTNEELQSANEELETTNEELQSTNEEMETMNEELQSTNEELETTNEELRLRSDDLNRVNAYLELILGSLRGGVAVLDANYLVQLWSPKAEDLWGLRAEEVRGKNLLGLDFGLPLEELKPPLRACLGGEAAHQEVLLDATNRRGKAIRCRVTCSPMGDGVGVRGAILVMDDGEDPGPVSSPGGPSGPRDDP